jgi:hypothetical protein
MGEMEDWKIGGMEGWRIVFQPSILPSFHLTRLLVEVIYQKVS